MQLKLDFNLNGSQARLDYINTYLESINEDRLTDDNLEMLSNYLLWGLQSETTDFDIEIESKNSPWSKGKSTVSLDAMLEQEQDTGMPVQSQFSKVQLAQKKPKIERANIFTQLRGSKLSSYWTIARQMIADPAGQIQKFLPQEVFLSTSSWNPNTDAWFNLWNSIDTTEFMIQNWELQHGKRRADLPIREDLHFRLACSLLWRFSEGETAVLSTSLEQFEQELIQGIQEWSGYDYLKKKRTLVQLRTQQYVLLDGLRGEVLSQKVPTAIYWEDGHKGLEGFLPFQDVALCIPEVQEDCFSPAFYKKCVEALRAVDLSSGTSKSNRVIDLRDPEVMRQVLMLGPELNEVAARGSDLEVPVVRALLRYVDYYIQMCEFDPELLIILKGKMTKKSNKEIADQVQAELGITYKENYISTIFTKRIIAALVEQVNTHLRLIEFITMGPTVFKRCSRCQKLLPRNDTYFNRRTSTSDGFFSNCKKCKTRR